MATVHRVNNFKSQLDLLWNCNASTELITPSAVCSSVNGLLGVDEPHYCYIDVVEYKGKSLNRWLGSHIWYGDRVCHGRFCCSSP